MQNRKQCVWVWNKTITESRGSINRTVSYVHCVRVLITPARQLRRWFVDTGRDRQLVSRGERIQGILFQWLPPDNRRSNYFNYSIAKFIRWMTLRSGILVTRRSQASYSYTILDVAIKDVKVQMYNALWQHRLWLESEIGIKHTFWAVEIIDFSDRH